MPGTGNGAENLVEEGDERSRFMSKGRVDKEVVVVKFLGVYISTGQDSEERSSLKGLGSCDLQTNMAHWNFMSR